ncbi:LLM class flavin-dependent oxidoreductase [Rhizobium rhizogenes]|uniref:LLM class flavin-dependent oxidoreductase n=1 Tax=Rhizobium rhizogenes TaxID=359 RepID=UPI001296A369|nr:LLM class flavin-dependent oxidoreductase [Rhizobium rhizogenes]MQB35187.1 LLM class flavin-dependent oxidoreductase [Rhizobium rhizogenes]
MKFGYLDLGKRFEDVPAADRIPATLRLARVFEEVGVSRWWLAEHHVPDVALHAAEVILPLVGAATERIAIGAAGVLLRYYSPLRVWEAYCTLAAAFPGRIDLGICRGPGVADPLVAEALVFGNAAALAQDAFPAKVRELFRIVREGTAARGLEVDPDVAPQLWLLGSGHESARLAIELRARYGYLCFFPGALELSAAVTRPFGHGRAVLALSAMVGDTDEGAQAYNEANVRRGYHSANAVGCAATCAAIIREIAARAGVEEIVIATLSPRLADQEALVPLFSRLVALSAGSIAG